MGLNPSIRQWQGRKVWIVGASTGIGAALAKMLLEKGASLALSARNATQLEQVAQGKARVLPLDVCDPAAVAAAASSVHRDLGGLDLVIWLAGTYHPMGAKDFDLAKALTTTKVNYEAVLSGVSAILPILLQQGHGGLALVSSVAGYSGLPKAVAYGPTKAALINLAESLYLHCQPLGIGIYLVSPGFVATPLTAQNDFHMPALISPETAAHEIIHGLEKGAFEIHFPKRFSRVLKLARLLPYRLYFALAKRAT
jgi:short-subunit dehydrogenase